MEKNDYLKTHNESCVYKDNACKLIRIFRINVFKIQYMHLFYNLKFKTESPSSKAETHQTNE